MEPITKLVVLTRDAAGNRRWAADIEQAGFRAFSAPMIQTAPVPLSPHISGTLGRLADFDWLVLTSARAVTALQALSGEAGINLGHVPPVAAVGSQTAAAAARAGWAVGYEAQPATADALANGLAPVKDQHILLARTNIADRELPDRLQSRGALVTDLTVYRTVSASKINHRLEELVRDRQVGWVIFASPSAVAGWLQSLSPAMLERARSLPVLAIGQPTGQAAAAAGFRHVKAAPEPNVKGIVLALTNNET